MTGPLADRLRAVAAADLLLADALRLARDSALPDAWIAAGAVYGAVWNALAGRPCGHGVGDVDLIYFDPDPSLAAEDAAIARVAALGPLPRPVQVRNQARVHLWFPARFGAAYPPLADATASLARYLSHAQAVALRLDGDGAVEIAAPFGLDALFDRRLTPNAAAPEPRHYGAHRARVLARWPEVAAAPGPG